MPKLGAQPIRRAALIKATIEAIGAAGHLEVTVAQIARKAGMSPALAHHYFGSKDQIFLAAMRHILSHYRAEVHAGLKLADGPRARLGAIIHASFSDQSFRDEVIGAWMNFYTLARHNPEARRLLELYQRRLRSNLLYNLRPLVGARASEVAETTAALIDGMYLRAALSRGSDARAACMQVTQYLAQELTRHTGRAQ